MTTTHVRAQDLPERWMLYDASREPLGRMAAKIAKQLMGKDQPTYTPSEPCGAHVVVVNAEQAVFTGRKNEQKTYGFYSGYPGGLKERSVEYMRGERPADIVKLAVKRMLPKSRLGRTMLSNLRVYAGPDHPHQAQAPTPAQS
jgi:large subunit ribosomal protein L13